LYLKKITGKQVEIWLAQEKEPLFMQSKVFNLKRVHPYVIVSIIPGDYNADSEMDLLITYKLVDDTTKFYMSLFLGDKKSQFSNNLEDEIELEMNCTDQPFVGE
jgi:hypothetical protein